MTAEQSILEARNITKIYPNGVRANRNVNLSVTQGEIHALVGENGAGKTTLMKILYGMEHPTQGQVLMRGQPVQIASPQDAIRLGIGMVHQKFMLVPSFTIAENVVLNREPVRSKIVVDGYSAALTRMITKCRHVYSMAHHAGPDADSLNRANFLHQFTQ